MIIPYGSGTGGTGGTKTTGAAEYYIDQMSDGAISGTASGAFYTVRKVPKPPLTIEEEQRKIRELLTRFAIVCHSLREYKIIMSPFEIEVRK